MPNPWSQFCTLRPCFVGTNGFTEDFYDSITLQNTNGSIQGWTLAAHLYTAAGVELVGAAAVTITNATAGIIQVAVVGLQLTAAQDLTLLVYRIDPAARTQVAWATLEVVNPLQQLGWAQGNA